MHILYRKMTNLPATGSLTEKYIWANSSKWFSFIVNCLEQASLYSWQCLWLPTKQTHILRLSRKELKKKHLHAAHNFLNVNLYKCQLERAFFERILLFAEINTIEELTSTDTSYSCVSFFSVTDGNNPHQCSSTRFMTMTEFLRTTIQKQYEWIYHYVYSICLKENTFVVDLG